MALSCPCACNSGGFCGGCGHAGCSGGINLRRDPLRAARYTPFEIICRCPPALDEICGLKHKPHDPCPEIEE